MNLFVICRLFQFSRNLVPIQYMIQIRDYAIPVKGGMKKLSKKTLSATEKKLLSVETNVNKLLTYVCGTNIYKEEGEDIKIKPDSEYPDWLWALRTGPPLPLEELDVNTKQYWRRLRLLGLRRNNKERATRKF